MTFLSPVFAMIGLVAATIPIIIHLLFRRRSTRVDWAPMKYLKLTVESNRQRIQCEQFLLLLVRVLVVLFVFLIAAKPMLSKRYSSWLAPNQSISRVLVIDDSMSMQTICEGGRTAFQHAQAAAIELIGTSKSTCELAVLATSSPDKPLLRLTQLDDTSQLYNDIHRMEPNDLSNRWASVFAYLDELLPSTGFSQREVVLITDLQRSGWGVNLPRGVDNWNDTMLTIVDVGQGVNENLAVCEIRNQNPVALSNWTNKFEATVHNFSDQESASSIATFSIDGQSQSVTMPRIPAHSDVQVPFSIYIAEPGQRELRFTISDDRLPADNSRFFSIDAKANLSMLIIDGDPRPESMAGEADFLVAACRSGSDLWGIQKRNNLRKADLTKLRPQVLVLANVSVIDDATKIELEKQVAAGMGLVIYAGGLIDAVNYNRQLHGGGQGILPFTIGQPVDDQFAGLVPVSHGTSPLEVFRSLPQDLLNRVRPRRVLGVGLPDANEPMAGRLQLHAHWNSDTRLPALLEARFGKGRVFFWTTTADREWCDWQIEPSFVIATRQTMLFAASGTTQNSLVAGDEMRWEIPVSEQPKNISLQLPKNRADVALSPELNDASISVRADNTSQAGSYRLKWQSKSGQSNDRLFSVNPDITESSLQRMTRPQLAELFGDTNWRLVSAKDLTSGGESSSKLWRAFAVILLTLLGVETCLAAWIGRAR